MMKVATTVALALSFFLAIMRSAHADTSCTAALHNAYAVVDAGSVQSLKDADAQHPEAESVAACETGKWSDEVRSCLAAARSVDDIYHDCYARPFKTQKLAIGRSFDVGNAEQMRTKPAPMSRNGDYLALAPSCGFLYQEAPGGFQAMFVVCDGKTQGPLTMPDEIKAAFAAAAANEQNRHDIVMSLVKKTHVSYFGGDHRVCDRYNNCHIE